MRSVVLAAQDDAPPLLEGDGRRVYVLARKILIQNTRIFKQARSLTDAGYDVTLIGILPRGGLTSEQRDGYAIIRLPLDPLYARVPRRIRQAARAVNRALIRRPFRFLVAVLRLRQIPYRAIRRLRRGLHVAVFVLGNRRRAAIRVLRRRIDADPRRRRARFRLLRRWQIAVSMLFALGAAGTPRQVAAPAPWKRVLLVPVVLLARLLRLTGAGLQACLRGLARVRESRPAYALLRWVVRAEERGLRAASELLVRGAVRILQPIAWPLKSIEYYKVVRRAVTSGLAAPDVIHANDLDTLWIASVLARRHRVPLVYDAQELYTGLHTLPRWYRRMLAVQERVLIRRTQGTIVVNDAIRDVMERKYKIQIDTVVLNCPPLVEDLGDGRSLTVRQLFDLPDDALVLLYSGALGPNRGLANTVMALEHLDRHTHLVLLGEGPLRFALEQLARDLSLDDRVLFADFVHHLDVPSFISSADVGIIPYENVGVNHYLCSPSKLFHYIMAGLPIACSDFPFLRTVVVGNGIGSVFDPRFPRSIADAVRKLTDDHESSLGYKRNLAQAKHKYCWEEQEKLFMSVYRSLPQRPAVRPGGSRR